MSRYWPCGVVILLVAVQGALRADDPVFSGPQVGERLPPFTARGVFGDLAGKEFDLIERSAGKSVALIFVHARTRPAFRLTNTIMKFAASKSREGLESGVVFLTDDPTATEKWMHVVAQHFPQGVVFGISIDGAEGPGSYGLNRNVTLTVLVGKQGTVTANFALVQPSLPADGPKILQAIVDVAGGGKVPTIAELSAEKDAGRARMKLGADENDPQLAALLRAVINKQASAADVEMAVAAVEKYIEKNENARQQLGRIANTVVNSGKLSNYGTDAAQKILRRWAKEQGPAANEQQN
jgi:hypothetical protein